jgi:tetratricopeptide (TPR) repeat protein
MAQQSSSRAAQGSFGMENRDMARLFKPRQFAFGLVLAAGAMLAADAVPAEAQQAGGRMKVLVPAFEVENPRSRTGSQMADQVKRQINQMATHQPVGDREVRDALRRFNLKAEDLSCIQWRQLAQQIDASLVLCGSVDETTKQVEASFVNVAGDAFDVPEFAMQSVEHGAQQVVQAFGTYIRQLSLLVFCDEYLQSESWQQALDNCNQAVELNPRSVTGHYGRGSALANLDRIDEALEAFQTVLRVDELNQDAMMHAGLLAARLGRQDMSQEYFRNYLELNPGNEQVRLKIATDLANAGDPAGALTLVEDAMSSAEATGTLWEYAGHFAMNAGLKRMEAGPANGNQDEARRFFQQAVRHYDEAIVKRGDSIDNTVYRNLMLAHSRLDNTEQALQFGQRATQIMADDAQTWMVYADVLAGADRIDEALRAFDRATEINPELPNVSARKTMLLLEAGRLNDALAAARAGIQRGDIQPDMIESMSQRMTQMGFQTAQNNRFEQALPFFAAAREIGKSGRSIAMANFFHGYTLIRQGEPIIKQGNNAAAGRRAKPLFEQAKVLLEGAGAYSEQAANRAQLLQQVQQFIDVADALIKAGR